MQSACFIWLLDTIYVFYFLQVTASYFQESGKEPILLGFLKLLKNALFHILASYGYANFLENS